MTNLIYCQNKTTKKNLSHIYNLYDNHLYDECINNINKIISVTHDKKRLSSLYLLLSQCHYGNKNFQISHHFLKKRIAIIENDRSMGLGNTYSFMGILLRKLKKYDIAISYYKKSNEIYKKYHLNDRINGNNLNISLLYLDLHKYDMAMISLMDIIAHTNNKKTLGIAYFNIGFVNQKMGMYNVAIRYYKKSMILNNNIVKSAHINIADCNMRLGYYGQSIYHSNISDTIDRGKNVFLTIKSLYIKGMVSFHRKQIVDCYHKLNKCDSLFRSCVDKIVLESDKHKFITNNIYNKLIDVAYQLYKKTNKIKYKNDILFYMDIGKYSITNQKRHKRKSISIDFTISDVTKSIPDNHCIINFVVTKKYLYSFFVSNNKSVVYRKNISNYNLKLEITRFRNNIRGDYDHYYLNRGYFIYRLLFGHLSEELLKIKKIIIIPDILLSTIPFDALITKKQSPLPNHVLYPYFIKQNNIIIGLSLKSFLVTTNHTTYDYDFIGISPNFTNQSVKHFLKPISYNIKEVHNISKQFQKKKVFSSRNVYDNVINMKISAKYVHFATHSFLYNNTPTISLGISKNQFININNIDKLNISANHLVISSCDGVLGNNINGEGIMNLVKEFYIKNIKTIVYSLWSVSDYGTYLLMLKYYNYINMGYDYPSALRYAKLSMISNLKTSLPSWWSSFTIVK